MRKSPSTRGRPRTPSPRPESKKCKPEFNAWPTFLYNVMLEIIKTKNFSAETIERIMEIIENEEASLSGCQRSALLDSMKLIKPELLVAELVRGNYVCSSEYWQNEDTNGLDLHTLNRRLSKWIDDNFNKPNALSRSELCKQMQSGRKELVTRLRNLDEIGEENFWAHL